MRAFLDFEASSLGRKSYPVEVAWVFEDGRGEDHLIRPAPDWTDWDEEAARMHGIDRARLWREGEDVTAVATRLVEALTGHDLYASAPSWDGKWLSALLRAGGYPRHLLRLNDSEEAFAEAAAARLGSAADGEGAAELVASTMERFAREPAAHRALADARRELAVYRAILSG